MFLGDIEVFRTSTAEPTQRGIVWSYVKEMYHYGPLWKSEQKVIFDLGNLVNDMYTGTFNTTLTATFFTAPDTPEVADIILPISARRSSAGQGSAFSVPAQPAIIVHEFPLNIKKAVVSLAACGQDHEEFWYSNVLSSTTETFGSGAESLGGYSAFREVQLLIDGKLAGVAWPFPIIFTGGLAPGLWKPVVGIDAFDLREYEIDITPFVPLLCDGKPHAFQIQVVGLKEDGVNHAVLSETVGKSWVVSGKIFLFLNEDGHRTTGYASTHETSPPYIQISSKVTQNAQGANDTLMTDLSVTRNVYISTLIATRGGGFRESWWRQELTFTSSNEVSDEASIQVTNQVTTGFDQSKSDYQTHYRYPLNIRSKFLAEGNNIQIEADLSRNKYFTEIGPSVFPPGYIAVNRSSSGSIIPEFIGGVLSTQQTGHSKFLSVEGDGSYSYGGLQQEFSYRGIKSGDAEEFEIYRRHVEAVNSTVVNDEEVYLGERYEGERGVGVEDDDWGNGGGKREEGFYSVRAMLGRGPGSLKWWD